MQHTKGPWNSVQMGVNRFYYSIETYEEGKPIAETATIVKNENTEANARLIAAAPDLLQALEDAVGYLELETDLYGFNRHQEAIDKAKAVLTKAKNG